MPQIESWKDVDQQLERIALLDLDIATTEAEMGRELLDLMNKYNPRLQELRESRNACETRIMCFCMLRKDEFAKKRSRQLTFGKIAFRVAEKVDFPKSLEGVIIATLRRVGHGDCVKTEEKVDKQAVKQLSDNDLAKCGLKREKMDHFRVEPNLHAAAEALGRSFETPTVKLDLAKLGEAVSVKEADQAA